MYKVQVIDMKRVVISMRVPGAKL